MLRRHAANAITMLRVALTPLFLLAVVTAANRGSGWSAAGVFVLVAISDFTDGRVARRYAASSALGRGLDHFADIAFILSALAVYVHLGVAPWWVPAAIAASFAVYVLDSLRRSEAGPGLIGSRLGHIGGVMNYVVIGVLVGNQTVGLHWLPAWTMLALFALVPCYSAASIVSRLTADGEPLALSSRL